MDQLMYRRQFLLSRESIAELSKWNIVNISSYYLYIHPDIQVNLVKDNHKCIVLIGSLYDPYDSQNDNSAILKDIQLFATSIKAIFPRIKKYAGCYVMLFQDGNELYVWSDARATQEVYYCTKNNVIVCGSQPNLISEFASPEIGFSKDPLLIDFYNNFLWDSRWVGDETYYENIKHLLPNHFLNIDRQEACRYWPTEPINPLSLEDAVSKSCLYLQGIMKSIAHRHSVMMAVTAGTDTRTLLAASKDLTNNIYYFVNNFELDYDNPDIEIPKRIFNDIGMHFHIHHVLKDVDDEFRRTYFRNTFLATDRLLPSIYNVFYKDHNDKVLVLGVGEIGRTFYGLKPKRLTSHRMASKLGYSDCPYALAQFNKYIAEMLPAAEMYGINPMIILYWEQRLGNWGATRNSESNIAIEKIDPFNSHLLNEIFLGVDEKHKNYQDSLCTLFKEMIRTMWPELLEYPVNPSVTVRDRFKSALMTIGAYEVLKELKYQVSYMRILYRTKR